MTERAEAVMAVYLILQRDGKILLGRRKNSGFGNGEYQVPAGHVEAGERPTETMIREAKEEINIVIKPEDLRVVHTMFRLKHDETGNRFDIFFEASTWRGVIQNKEPNKCDHLLWARPDEFPENMVKHARYALQLVTEGIHFSEPDRDLLRSWGYLKD